MEFEPPRHSPFDTAHGGKERVAYDPSYGAQNEAVDGFIGECG